MTSAEFWGIWRARRTAELQKAGMQTANAVQFANAECLGRVRIARLVGNVPAAEAQLISEGDRFYVAIDPLLVLSAQLSTLGDRSEDSAPPEATQTGAAGEFK